MMAFSSWDLVVREATSLAGGREVNTEEMGEALNSPYFLFAGSGLANIFIVLFVDIVLFHFVIQGLSRQPQFFLHFL